LATCAIDWRAARRARSPRCRRWRQRGRLRSSVPDDVAGAPAPAFAAVFAAARRCLVGEQASGQAASEHGPAEALLALARRLAPEDALRASFVDHAAGPVHRTFQLGHDLLEALGAPVSEFQLVAIAEHLADCLLVAAALRKLLASCAPGPGARAPPTVLQLLPCRAEGAEVEVVAPLLGRGGGEKASRPACWRPTLPGQRL